MHLVSKYSHFNGEEYLLVHKPNLWEEVREVIAEVDAESCKTKISKEKTIPSKTLYSPPDMNKAFKNGLETRGWKEHRNAFWEADDEKQSRSIYTHPPEEQKEATEKVGLEPSYNQTDFLKERVAIEIQFSKYPFVAHEIFVKHLSFYTSDVIDVGIEILPMKKLEMEMTDLVPYYERGLQNIIRHGRGAPAVPLILIGVAP